MLRSGANLELVKFILNMRLKFESKDSLLVAFFGKTNPPAKIRACLGVGDVVSPDSYVLLSISILSLALLLVYRESQQDREREGYGLLPNHMA